MAGVVLHPFLRAALPLGTRLQLWTNVVGVAFAGALPVLLYPLLVSSGHIRPGQFIISLAVSTCLSVLPHLWFVGRSVRRALREATP